jgi:hypothetical protein
MTTTPVQFYNNDSYTFQITQAMIDANPSGQIPHFPGAFNLNAIFNSGDTVNLKIEYAELEAQIYGASNLAGGFATDIHLQIYDVTTGTALPCGLTPLFGYFGNVTWPEAPLISSLSRNGYGAPARLICGDNPLLTKATMLGTNSRFQPGARFTFDNGMGPCVVVYQYRVKGLAWAS